ncbi:hypothetical protein K490DRAFT_42560 [Saccharata proteae CBS 121410]|uniref:ABC transporter TMD0 domain-containing protein n=1 Tax=Saccharata proteae CBS 121410 TaxID=1314787 RepID=A0A9P4HUM3_9PEZI|nr:hypothetical protein K490DRAFT_42560 [Saccharata proteae CBS 121410]
MVQLCRNRPEGFGPHSSLHPNIPTTCFLDVIVEPLATWLFLLFLTALLPLRYRSYLRRHPRNSHPALTSTRPTKPGLVSRVASAIYYILVVCLLAMASLEIARLVVAELGIGLLPFTYVGVLAALANRLTWPCRVSRLANAAFWLMLVVVMGLKTAAEADEMGGRVERRKATEGVGRYPTSDEVIDNAVMVGVEVGLAALEFVGWKGMAWL